MDYFNYSDNCPQTSAISKQTVLENYISCYDIMRIDFDLVRNLNVFNTYITIFSFIQL